jgi:hypothetical protein
LGERSNRTAEVVGSIPIGSTKFPHKIMQMRDGPRKRPFSFVR